MTGLPEGVTLRPATLDDARAGALMHIACWREAYASIVDPGLLEAQVADAESWTQRWREHIPRHPRLLAVYDGEPVGFAAAGEGRDRDAPVPTELYALYVREAWYGSGLGHALCEAAVGDRAAYLWVLEGNDRARAFYERQGFRADGARERFAPLDAWEIRMVRP